MARVAMETGTGPIGKDTGAAAHRSAAMRAVLVIRYAMERERGVLPEEKAIVMPPVIGWAGAKAEPALLYEYTKIAGLLQALHISGKAADTNSSTGLAGITRSKEDMTAL